MLAKTAAGRPRAHTRRRGALREFRVLWNGVGADGCMVLILKELYDGPVS